MPKATGLAPRKAVFTDRESVIFGNVRAGEGVDAESRNGAARLMPFKLNICDFFKVVAVGGLANAAGGYFIEVAHVDRDAAVGAANPTGYVRIGSISLSGTNPTETGFSGPQVEALVKAAASPAITGDVRVTALRLVAGTGVSGEGSNGLAAPANTTGATIHIQRG
jgi:hypothetical protein